MRSDRPACGAQRLAGGRQQCYGSAGAVFIIGHAFLRQALRPIIGRRRPLASRQITFPYGIQKLMGEHYARTFFQLYGLETVALRYFNVYGPGQNPASAYAAVIPKFLTRHFSGQTSVIFGDGEQTRDFCHVKDVVQANILAAETSKQEALGGVFNVACGSRISVNELIVKMRDALGEGLSTDYQAERAGDIKHSGADISKIVSQLGYSPKIQLESGLQETAAYYRDRS